MLKIHVVSKEAILVVSCSDYLWPVATDGHFCLRQIRVHFKTEKTLLSQG